MMGYTHTLSHMERDDGNIRIISQLINFLSELIINKRAQKYKDEIATIISEAEKFDPTHEKLQILVNRILELFHLLSEERVSQEECLKIEFLIRKLEIFQKSLQRKLPLSEPTRIKEIINGLDSHDVLILKSGENIGKSSMLPFLLQANIIEHVKIAIAQPSNLAAVSLFNFTKENYGVEIVGLCTDSISENLEADVIYFTQDALQKYLSPFLSCPFQIVILDDVQERTKELEICIALLALKNSRKKMPKLVISSSIIDDEITKPFSRAGLSLETISLPSNLKKIEEHSKTFCVPGCKYCQEISKKDDVYSIIEFISSCLGHHEQMLVFLSSSFEVMNACNYLNSKKIKAKPLYEELCLTSQLEIINEERILICTECFQNRLYLPNLKFVIDSGRTVKNFISSIGVNRTNVLGEVSKTAYLQRKSRLGRAFSGHYICLYSQETKILHDAKQIIKSEKEIEEILFIANQQLANDITGTLNLDFPWTQLNQQKILHSLNLYSKYPYLGGKDMMKVFHKNPKIRMNIICLVVFINTFRGRESQAIMLKAAKMLKMNGEISTASHLIYLLINEFKALGNLEIIIKNWSIKNGMIDYYEFLILAVKKAHKMIQICKKNNVDPYDYCNPDHHQYNQLFIGELVKSFKDSIYLSSFFFGGSSNTYRKALNNDEKTINLVHPESLLRTEEDFPKAILCLKINPSDELIEIGENNFKTAVLEYCEAIDLNWINNMQVEENIMMDTIGKVKKDSPWQKGTFNGTLSKLLIETLKANKIKSKLIKVPLTNEKVYNELKDLKLGIFNQLKKFWGREYQLNIINILVEFNLVQFMVSGFKKHIRLFEENIFLWVKHLNLTNCLRNLEGRSLLKFQMISKLEEEMKNRLNILCAKDISQIELWNMANDKNKREKRMSIVCWIAIHIFKCKVVGGFIRDWIINGKSVHPNQPFNKWIVKGKYQKYDMVEGVVPKDIDIELSASSDFDVHRFITFVRLFGISVDFYEHIPQRYVFIFDKNEGPFMADFIEPHFSALHTQVDFDVNALCVESNYEETNLNLKVPLDTTVDDIILKIQRKEFTVNKTGVDERIEKKNKKNWKCMGYKEYKPKNWNHRVQINMLSDESHIYRTYHEKIRSLGGKNIVIYNIINPTQNNGYDFIKKDIALKNEGEYNEKELFHGTNPSNITSIIENGFLKSKWKSNCIFGAGVYHAEDPALSLTYSSKSNPRTLFVCKVLLGKQLELCINPTTEKFTDFKSKNCDSVKGRMITIKGTYREIEHVVYREKQSIPYLLIDFDL